MERNKVYDSGAVGGRLKTAREEAGHTQKSAGRAVGLSQAAISRHEKGETMPSAEQVVALCSLYRADPTWVLMGSGGLDPKDPREIVEAVKRRLHHEDHVYEFAAQARVIGLEEETWRQIANGTHRPGQASIDAMIGYLRSPRPESQADAMRAVLDRVEDAIRTIRDDLGVPRVRSRGDDGGQILQQLDDVQSDPLPDPGRRRRGEG